MSSVTDHHVYSDLKKKVTITSVQLNYQIYNSMIQRIVMSSSHGTASLCLLIVFLCYLSEAKLLREVRQAVVSSDPDDNTPDI